MKVVSAAFLSAPMYDPLQSITQKMKQIVEAQHGQ
jgi:hypothetical protein